MLAIEKIKKEYEEGKEALTSVLEQMRVIVGGTNNG